MSKNRFIFFFIASLITGICFIPSIILALDTRRPVSTEEANQYPYNLSLFLQNDDGGYYSGTLIRHNLILTAAHPVSTSDGTLKNIKTISIRKAGERSTSYSKKSLFVKNPIYRLKNYTGYENLENDISIIKITSPSLLLNSTNTDNAKIAIYSNPHNLIGKEITTVSQSYHAPGFFTTSSGKILDVLPSGTLLLDMYSSQGQSGSPILLKDGSIIGVLVSGTDDCRGISTCSQTEATPFTLEMKEELFDKVGITNIQVFP